MGVVKCNERLDQMDERRVPLTTLQLINQRIVGQKKEKSGGFEERIKSLRKIYLDVSITQNLIILILILISMNLYFSTKK